MITQSSLSRGQTASTTPAKLLGFAFGALAFVAALASLPAHRWAAFRQSIPVAMSLAEAEENYKLVRDESKQTIVDLSNRANQLTQTQDTDGNQLVNLLRGQAMEMRALRSQQEVLASQCSKMEELIAKELSNWASKADQMDSSTVRVIEQQKIVASEIAYLRKLANAKSDLAFVERVLKEGADIERLAQCVEHEMTIAKSLEGLGSLTGEVVAFAKRMQGTTQSVLLAWK